jgi:hypothetical protein
VLFAEAQLICVAEFTATFNCEQCNFVLVRRTGTKNALSNWILVEGMLFFYSIFFLLICEILVRAVKGEKGRKNKFRVRLGKRGF